MSNFQLSDVSKKNLQGVNARLVAVVKRALAISAVDFRVIEGVRTKERQQQLFKQGATKTLNSRHLTGHAVDIVPLPVDWKNKSAFKQVANAMFTAADELGIAIRWGGDWNRNGKSEDERFYDGPHFELLER
ncbi:peptidase M15 [Pasteurellaceae bacterium Macca]|nr:peptidase M15 [Pasteurellaceae bacterium Macca]MCK3656162.1 peptidase M15 [Pasteurellaceae bacterium Macca]MCK3656430.1 peptidase M15 [Pasteurellaceae bacterium Macca]MCK3656625.1 peptidase M15 [Pasteurellaceae bacterium Macca]MCK3657100.1 peptidase M15 [Pasteurellaceae bacterium Macca]